jgi:anthranilate phosphoribosyltransferase
VLAGEVGPARDIVLLNAAAALLVAEAATTLEEGLGLAARSVDSGAALGRLEALAEAGRRAAAGGGR